MTIKITYLSENSAKYVIILKHCYYKCICKTIIKEASFRRPVESDVDQWVSSFLLKRNKISVIVENSISFNNVFDVKSPRSQSR